ncbi:hypothetical protein CKSOR_00244 [Candidatus Kinetoplastibacterium sorsogonicusi]|uniref:Protein IscX n=1 Tax=Candidatus Kinetoplastidibacterium kentomonadis TaxID=1576550 RepID=A0A3S7J9M6_9PROT|nr:Fe-S cluster assembly protein IscX [Candidatus Kinetoplastibacterium sorsogonicusi]AWD32366.1 hypothetical protein CKSOR_00244 [Candidatus Kinetoplastibacterium sorsogonicusi]
MQKNSEINWIDIYQIVDLLIQLHSNENPKTISFVKLRELIVNLPNFKGDKNRCNEKILESIQMTWIDEIS